MTVSVRKCQNVERLSPAVGSIWFQKVVYLLFIFFILYLNLEFECAFGLGLKIKIISLFNLFLLIFMSFTVLFQLTFTFIYSTFSNNFLVLAK